MTKVSFLLLLANIWLAQGAKDKDFSFRIGLFYLLAAIVIGLLGIK